jgi:hypothetical protein
LITDERIKFVGIERDLYVVDVSAYGGNSGSPVFFLLGSDHIPGRFIFGEPVVKLAGIMSGTFQDVQPIRAMEHTAIIPGAPSNTGLAAVVPTYKLRELLFGEELSKARTDAEAHKSNSAPKNDEATDLLPHER